MRVLDHPEAAVRQAAAAAVRNMAMNTPNQVGPVPVQMWQWLSQVPVQMWQGCAQPVWRRRAACRLRRIGVHGTRRATNNGQNSSCISHAQCNVQLAIPLAAQYSPAAMLAATRAHSSVRSRSCVPLASPQRDVPSRTQRSTFDVVCCAQAALAAEGAIGKLLKMMREADSSASREAGIKALKVPEPTAVVPRCTVLHYVVQCCTRRAQGFAVIAVSHRPHFVSRLDSGAVADRRMLH